MKSMEEFKTILQSASSEIEEKKSKFIAHIFYVEKVEEAKQRIKEMKKRYFDAKHHCYAYRIIEEDGIKEKQSDDGEPSGTAGAPMLNILKKNDLCNVAVIITRYFGGILLGTGGLVKAYSDATLEAICKADIGMQQLGYKMKVVIEYKDLQKFKYYCRKNGICIVDIIYEENIICMIELTNTEKERLIDKNQKDVQILENVVLQRKYIRLNIE